MPILKLKPACKNYLWGGDRLLTEFHLESDVRPLAEAWMLSCHKDGPSIIQNGVWSGMTLPQFLEQAGLSALGSAGARLGSFPILIKLIDAKEKLSIQVHPSDEYALEHEGEYGKTEMWYILDAEPGAFLYYGFQKALTREEFSAAIKENTLPRYLNAVNVHAGDVFFIPSGTLHAVGKGILLAEVQQSSNVTYRVSDYGRVGADGKPRALHIEQALAVTNLRPSPAKYTFGGHLAKCEYFTVDRMDGSFSDICGADSFVSLLILEGAGVIRLGDEKMNIQKGDSLFLPAGSGLYKMEGPCAALRTYIERG